MSKVTSKQTEELQRLSDQSEEDIDTSEIAEVIDWSQGERGRFYRPRKQQVTLRIDADVLAWFKTQGGKYQTRINTALREYIEQRRR